MTKARTNASASPAVGRNIVINGAMNVAQRATSVTGIGASATFATVDRWEINTSNTAGRLTMSQTADGPNGISANCIKLDCTTADASIAANEFTQCRTMFEGQNLQRIGKGVAGAQQVTVSFYVKASAIFTFGCELFDKDNNRQITKLFATTTDWVRHEITFPADVDDGSSPFADDNAESLRLIFWLHAGSNFTGGTLNTAAFNNRTDANRAVGISSFYSNTANNFFLTGVQMEVGPVATEFEQEQISTTLSKCQRYYQKQIATGSAFERFGNGFANTTGNFNTIIPMQVPMRATPAIETTGTVGNYGVYHANAVTAATGIAIDGNADGNGKQVGVNIADSNSGFTVGRSGMFIANNTAAAFIALSAEL